MSAARAAPPLALALTAALAVATIVAPWSAPPAAALEVPFLSGRVVDEAAMLDAETRQRVEAKLAAHEAETGSQVAVLTIPSLEGEPLEDYSLRVVETWKLGREGVDDGVLLLIARDDRKMRLEVGYGLEGQLTDLQSGRILDDVVRPRFRAGDFAGGIEAGVDAVVGTLGGDPEAIPPPEPAAGPFEAPTDMPWPARLAIMVIFLLVIGSFSLAGLTAPGCQGWFIYLFLMPFYAIFPAVALGPSGLVMVALWVLGFPIARLFFTRSAAGKRVAKRHTWLQPGTWSSGGGGGGFSGGGGGFSGGGGSFGGGGASSSW